MHWDCDCLVSRQIRKERKKFNTTHRSKDKPYAKMDECSLKSQRAFTCLGRQDVLKLLTLWGNDNWRSALEMSSWFNITKICNIYTHTSFVLCISHCVWMTTVWSVMSRVNTRRSSFNIFIMLHLWQILFNSWIETSQRNTEKEPNLGIKTE